MKFWKLFLVLLTIWSASLGIAWLLAPPSYVESSYWTWIFWIWFVAAVGVVRAFLALSSSGSTSSENELYDEDDDDISPSLLASDQLDITKNV